MSDRWTALVDDAVHEINMRWGVPLDASDEPDTEPLDQVMVRETAAAILRPIEDEVEVLRAALDDLIGNTGCMCDHPYVVGPCAKCRATATLADPRRKQSSTERES